MFDFLKKHELEISNLVSIGMDGPNVNLKFHREVEEKLTVDGDRGLLSVGSCPIHIANNGYNKLLSTLSAFINLDQFASISMDFSANLLPDKLSTPNRNWLPDSHLNLCLC